MDRDKLKNIPVMFQKLNQYNVENSDTRFIKVKIWIMHTGENLNGSVFTKEVIQNAIPSIANTPILCFIEENNEGELDFSDHRMKLVVEDNKIKTKYLGQAIGVIPESNNAQFENRLCDDGVTREFLTVEGLIWTKWDDPVDILDKNFIKSQSMEIHDDFEGEFKNNLFYYSKFSFFGSCILGDTVQPAMHSSTLEVQFNNNNVFTAIQNKIEEFKQYKNKLEGGSEVERQEILDKFSFLKGEDYDNIVNNNELSNEDLESQLFALSNSQINRAIRDELKNKTAIKQYWDGELCEVQKYYLQDVISSENVVVVEDNIDYGKYYGISYTMNGDVATLDYDNMVRYTKGDWRPFNEGVDNDEINPVFSQVEEELKTKFEELKNSFNATETEEYKALQTQFEELKSKNEELLIENTSLLEFKNNTLNEQKANEVNKILSDFSELEGFEGFSDIKSKAMDIEVEDLKEKLFALLGKKNYSLRQKTSKKENVLKVPASNFSKTDNNEGLSEAELRYGADIKNYI